MAVDLAEMSDDQDYVIDAMPVVKDDDNLLADGSKNYKGEIAKRDRTGGRRTAPLIFGPETCEKMAVVGIVTNLVPYLTRQLHLSSSYSANLVTTYQGTSYMLTLVGGFIADAALGRYLVVIVAATVQFFGLLLITLSAALPIFKPKQCVDAEDFLCPPQYGTPLIVIYVALYLIAIGTGGIKSSASAFGADQFDANDAKEKKNLAGFFSWYFFGISCGAFLAVTLLVWIQDNTGRAWGYLIPTAAMMVVVTAFVSGHRLYRYRPPKGSPLTQILQVFVGAYKKRKLQLPRELNKLYELSVIDQSYDYTRVRHSSQFRFLDKAAIIGDTFGKPEAQNLWRLSTVTRVEETKMVLRLMPILVTTSLFYTVYAQMTTFSVEQGSTMERKLNESFELPAASMAAFLQAAILITLALWEKLFVPIARRFTRNDKGTTSLQRIGIGLVISIVAMVVAAAVERKRIGTVTSENLELSNEDNITSKTVRMSIFWLLPQYILVGAGESLTYAGQLDFFYNESPKAMRSMGSALCICTLSLGYFTSTLLVSLVNSITGIKRSDGGMTGAWLPNDINQGRLDKFYWLLAAASFANFVLFVACAHWYKYKAEVGEEYEFSETSISEDEFANDVNIDGRSVRRNSMIILNGNDGREFQSHDTRIVNSMDATAETDAHEHPLEFVHLEHRHHRRQPSTPKFLESPEAYYLTLNRCSP